MQSMRLSMHQNASLTFAAVLGICTSVDVCAMPDMGGLNKDLQIMGTIMHTTLQQKVPNSNFRVQRVTSSYYAHQGATFYVLVNDGRWQLQDVSEEVDVAPSIPVSANSVTAVEELNLEQIDGVDVDIHIGTTDPLEPADNQLSDTRKRLRDYRHQARKLDFDKRAFTRQKQDREFEIRLADEDSKVQLQDELQQIEAALAQVEDQRIEVKSYITALERESIAQAESKKRRIDSSRSEFLRSFEQDLLAVLCRYGSGLKQLPNDQHVNVVLRNFAEERSERNDAVKDRIYVFPNASIQRCVSSAIDSNKLLAEASVYDF